MKEKQKTFEQAFIGLSDAIEKALVSVIYALIAIIIAAQALLQVDAVRNGITKVDALEGVPYESVSKR